MLDEFYWLNKEDPNYSKCRAIESGGKRIDTDGDFTLTKKAIKEILNLCLMKEEDLDDVKITDVFSRDFFKFYFLALLENNVCIRAMAFSDGDA